MRDPVSVALGGEWICLVCGVKCASPIQLESHLSGKRHAASIRHREVRGTNDGDAVTSFRRVDCWREIRGLIPVFPLLFDPSYAIPEHRSLEPESQCAPLRRRSADPVEAPDLLSSEPIPVDTPKVDQSATLMDSIVSLDNVFCSKLCVGEYWCELCEFRCVGRAGYIAHMSSEDHKMNLFPFSVVEADYFQPVIDSSTGRMYFVGLVTGSVNVASDFAARRIRVLNAQWRIAGRYPSAESLIMQTPPSDILFCLTKSNIG